MAKDYWEDSVKYKYCINIKYYILSILVLTIFLSVNKEIDNFEELVVVNIIITIILSIMIFFYKNENNYDYNLYIINI